MVRSWRHRVASGVIQESQGQRSTSQLGCQAERAGFFLPPSFCPFSSSGDWAMLTHGGRTRLAGSMDPKAALGWEHRRPHTQGSCSAGYLGGLGAGHGDTSH